MVGIKGTTVKLHIRTITGVDEFNAPIYQDSTEDVANVVICPSSDAEILNDMQMYGKHSVYVLCIPKGDNHEWEDTEVEFFGKKWHTFGAVTEYMEELVPLSWNKKVKVEIYA